MPCSLFSSFFVQVLVQGFGWGGSYEVPSEGWLGSFTLLYSLKVTRGMKVSHDLWVSMAR